MKGITLFNQPFDTAKKMQKSTLPALPNSCTSLKAPDGLFSFFPFFLLLPSFLQYGMYERYWSAMAIVCESGQRNLGQRDEGHCCALQDRS